MSWTGLKLGRSTSDAQICVIAETNVPSASQKTIKERKKQLEAKDLTLLPEQRQIIHDLILQKHATGLSPPEQEILLILESQELALPVQSEDCSGFFMSHQEGFHSDRKSNYVG